MKKFRLLKFQVADLPAMNILHADISFLQKRVFVEPFLNLSDPVEVDVVYHQSVTDLFEGKIPLTREDAVGILRVKKRIRFENTPRRIPQLLPWQLSYINTSLYVQ